MLFVGRLLLAMTLIVTAVESLAADNVSTIQTPAEATSISTQGFYLGLSYVNLTDVHTKYELEYHSSAFGTYKDSSYEESGTHLGMMGLNFGYERTPTYGFGMSFGLQLLDSINPSEYGTQKIYYAVPEANLTLGAGSRLSFFLGLNLSQFIGQDYAKYYTPHIGGQAGFAVRFHQRVFWKNGYTMLHQTYLNDDSRSSFKADLLMSGYNSSLNFVF